MKVSVLAMVRSLGAVALSSMPAYAQVHYPIITHTGNVTIIDTGIHETFAGVTYDERLYIMGSWQGYNSPMTNSESAEWFPVLPPPPVVVYNPPPPPPIVTPPTIILPPVVVYNPPPVIPPIIVPPTCLIDCGPTPPPVVAVPETSTWLMMLMGFGGLVFASRSARRAKAQRIG